MPLPQKQQQMSDTKTVMLETIRQYITEQTGMEAHGAIVILADITPLEEHEQAGHIFASENGAYFACKGLIATRLAELANEKD